NDLMAGGMAPCARQADSWPLRLPESPLAAAQPERNFAMPAHSPWQDDCHGAVSLTFDDGMTSQLQIAIPMLNDHSLRGTFYVNPRGDNWQERLEPWREAARTGHEIGNHTMAHPCTRAFRETGEPAGLEALSLEALE